MLGVALHGGAILAHPRRCQEDPSLAAHGCFWEYQPERVYEWELRLQPDFTIDEAGSDECHAQFLEAHPEKAQEIHDSEMKRREKEERSQEV